MTPDNIEAFASADDGSTVPNPNYLLFDDLVLLSKLRAEHDQLVKVLMATCGRTETYELRDLLRTLLHETPARTALINAAVELELSVWGRSVSEADQSLMAALEPHNLVKTLIRGTTADGRRLLTWPLPNMLFTRDLGAVVGSRMLLTYARKPARRREMRMARALFEFHPQFRGVQLLDIGSHVDDPAIEGGDVIVLDSDCVAIGVGQRTNEQSALAAAQLLLGCGTRCVYLVQLRTARSTMHLDTVFTLLDSEQCLVYGPSILDAGGAQITSVESGNRIRKRQGGWLDVLAEDGRRLTPIRCGGTDPVQQAREQWSDGANAFALAPGKILLYARNEQTLNSLNSAGFEVLTPDEFSRNARLILEDSSRRVVVALQGSELSRGRGGPRCLTLPLRRAEP